MTMNATRTPYNDSRFYADLRAFSLTFTPSSTMLPMKHTSQTCP